jgi:ubiquinone/menaquinone biosynthesis C-methylase UbiE
LADDAASQGRRSPTNVAQYFGRLAQVYGEGEFYIRRRVAVVNAIADQIARARRVLDLGCGNGRYLYEFRKSAASAIAIGTDITAEMLAEARIRNGVDTPLVRADVTAFPFRDATLDIIFGSHVFQFVADKDGTMRDLARCLAPGGAIIVTVGGSGIREAMRSFASEAQWTQLASAAFPSRRRIVAAEHEDLHREAMSRASLAIETRDVTFPVTWNGIVEWIDLRWSPFMDAEQRAIASRVLDEMAAQLSSRSFELSERLLIGRRTA